MKFEAQMEEHYLEYLLGTLEPATQQQVDEHLQADGKARARLTLLKRALVPLSADAEPIAPPPGLALATLARVAEHACSLPKAPLPSRRQAVAPSRRWRPIDWMVAASLLLLVAGLGLPLLARLWHKQQQTACKENLHKYWRALRAYSDSHDGDFPRVDEHGYRGVAGIFVPILGEAGVLGDVSTACPASGKKHPTPCSLTSLKTKFENDPVAFKAAAAELSGDYAYTLGYKDPGGTLRGLRNDSGDDLPILADGIQHSQQRKENSPNHHGSGQNVLFIGGQVRWCTTPTVGVEGDHIYMNLQQKVLAGLSRNDTVLAPGGARPMYGE